MEKDVFRMWSESTEAKLTGITAFLPSKLSEQLFPSERSERLLWIREVLILILWTICFPLQEGDQQIKLNEVKVS